MATREMKKARRTVAVSSAIWRKPVNSVKVKAREGGGAGGASDDPVPARIRRARPVSRAPRSTIQERRCRNRCLCR